MCSLYRNEHRNLKLVEATMGSELGGVKRTGRDFSFYLLCFYFYKIGEQEGETSSAQGAGVGTSGSGEAAGKGVGG
jgi:hypothetical protein